MRKKKLAIKILTYSGYAVFILFSLAVIYGWRGIMPVRLPTLLTPKNLGLPYEDITFSAPGGPLLKGWLILSQKGKGTIVCLHGYPSNRSDILPAVSFLYPDYNLFLFDFRAMGESGGKITTLGFREDADVLAAISYLRQKPETKNKPIGIWGYSMGGAIAILSAGKTREVKAVVTDSAFATLPEMIEIYYGQLKWLRKPLTFISCILVRAFFKMNPSEVNPEKKISQIRCPILLIHAVGDPLVPVEHAKRLYRSAKNPKELLLLGTDSHGAVGEGDYQTRINRFYHKHLH
ncbi:MAG: alpha/beta fold hydrolase [Candidatus Omnitrophota bacterium]